MGARVRGRLRVVGRGCVSNAAQKAIEIPKGGEGVCGHVGLGCFYADVGMDLTTS